MPDCACVYVDEYETPSFSTITNPTARKEHKCCECSRVILPGEKYENAKGVWDGDFSVYKTCADCLSVRDSFFCYGYMYMGMWEMMQEHIYEMMGEIDSSCIISLTPTARKKVCEVIEDYWEWCEDEDD